MSTTLGKQTLQELERELHNLCQPLTTLQCTLELGQMMDDCDSLREAVEDSLVETRRMFAAIAKLRERLSRESACAEEQHVG
jgi:regulator of replication initiation timing